MKKTYQHNLGYAEMIRWALAIDSNQSWCGPSHLAKVLNTAIEWIQRAMCYGLNQHDSMANQIL